LKKVRRGSVRDLEEYRIGFYGAGLIELMVGGLKINGIFTVYLSDRYPMRTGELKRRQDAF
jgi:hypothetical protein